MFAIKNEIVEFTASREKLFVQFNNFERTHDFAYLTNTIHCTCRIYAINLQYIFSCTKLFENNKKN